MLLFLQRHMRGLHLGLVVLLGLALGHLAATVLGVYLSPAEEAPAAKAAPTERSPRPSLSDYQVILERNVFDSAAAGAGSFANDRKAERPMPAPVSAQTDLKLLGTVAFGGGSLALLQAGRVNALYRIDDTVPGGGRVTEIARKEVTVRNRDGSFSLLPLYEGDTTRPAAPASKGTNGRVRSVGENRWVIDRKVAEQARGNMGELLKSARMEPRLVAGRTEGFTVMMVRPRSLLAELDIRKGDVLMEVNGMPLDSPEKALQVFQQLREARHISIGLQRNGSPMNFDYEVN